MGVVNSKRAFTLIEMIVVIAITGIILPAVFSIVFIIVQQQTKIYRLSEVKRQGDYILNIAENTIRNNVVSIHSTIPVSSGNIICDAVGTSGNASYFKDKSGNWFRFYLVTGVPDKISSQSASTNVDLNNSKVKISNFSLTCNRYAGYSSPIVSLSFQIGYNTTSTRVEDTVSMNYQVKVKLKSF